MTKETKRQPREITAKSKADKLLKMAIEADNNYDEKLAEMDAARERNQKIKGQEKTKPNKKDEEQVDMFPQLYAVGGWPQECNPRQVNIDAPQGVRDYILGIGEGTKNLRLTYLYVLGAAAAQIIASRELQELTGRKILSLHEDLRENPLLLLDMLEG